MSERRQQRWRLVLGKDAQQQLGDLGGSAAAMDDALGFLYDREGSESSGGGGSAGTGGGGSESSTLTTTDWLNSVHELFPASVREILHDDALHRYGIADIVTDPDILASLEPNTSLLKAVLATKHLMNDHLLTLAREVIRTVVSELLEKLSTEVRQPFSGRRDPFRRSQFRVAANFDAQRTVRENLKNVDPDTRQIIIKAPVFTTRVRRNVERWQVIIALDQSGSMAGSVIHGAVTASIFQGISTIRTHLVVFDTDVVDLTNEVGDPVEVLMRAQLGGGTDIARAVQYVGTLIENPRRTIVVLISDFYEGGSETALLQGIARQITDGVTFLALGALEDSGQANYNPDLARRIAALGAHTGVMTPDQLATFVAEAIG